MTDDMEDQAEQPEAMSEESLMAIVNGEIDRAKDFTLGLIGTERATAYDYYYGRKFGNEVPGRSQIISHDVAQQIDSAVPALIKFFAGSEKAVEFTARKAEDVKPAEQATELCNYVFYTQNNGFMLLHDAIKNALLQKTGCFKWYWDESVRVEEETYRDLPQELVDMLGQDPDMEIVAQSPSEQENATIDPTTGQPIQLVDVTVRKKKKSGKVKLVVIPPDELLVSDNCYGMDADDLPCVTHRTEKTLSDLVEMGYSQDQVLALASEENDYSMVSESRKSRVGDWHGSKHEIPDPMLKKVWYCETYIKLDFDGDGVAERRKVCSVGGTLLHNEVMPSVPMSFGTTKIMPHEFYGVSMADEVMDLQLRKSALLRQANDNLALAITPRIGVDTTRITNLDDVMTVRMGGVIRSDGDITGALQPILTPFVGQHIFPMVEYIDAEEETRTGVSRLMQGVDPNTLNKTATGVNALMNAAQARIELVARGLAETLIKPMFRGVMELMSKHQEEAQKLTIRLRNEYVPIDPRVWETEYDMTVNVGLGTGTKDQQMQHLTNIIAMQQGMLQTPAGQMFPPQTMYQCFYNAAAKLTETAGFKDASQFFPDPKQAQPPQPQPPEGVQIQQMKGEQAQQETQAELSVEQQKIQMEAQFKERELQLKKEYDIFKAQLDAQVKLAIGEMTAQAQAMRPQVNSNPTY